jgi:hypothetical protein
MTSFGLAIAQTNFKHKNSSEALNSSSASHCLVAAATSKRLPLTTHRQMLHVNLLAEGLSQKSVHFVASAVVQ